MKKSIAILGVLIMLVFRQCNYEKIQTSLKPELAQNTADAIVEKPSEAVFRYLKASEEENVPWKDPWQWRDLFRRMWKLWK